ncbi:DoxX family protein [Mycobacterium sp.]|uniref:DoxX family protein n=1 Tax=Mycobacterium sp. TaxID=1785 RepID=UPI002B7A52AC|nr:DoxX family protein [Mycobacterium sp.]HME49959.1 DoxX family protein [Mycobacterium sp.]
MSRLTSPRVYYALAAFQAADAVACAIPLPPIAKNLDDLGVPQGIRWVLPVVKAAAAVGLLSVSRFPRLARITTAMLTLYFVLAVGAHIRAHDRPVNAAAAASFLATFAVMTAQGPATADHD